LCGPTASEKNLESQQAGFSQLLQQDYAAKYDNQQGYLTELNNTLTPTLEAGPNQQGFSAPELAALNTQAINSTGANYANAARALNGQLAGRGGYNNGSPGGLTSGVDAQLKNQLASAAAGTLSNEQLGITQANYGQGNKNYQNSVAGVNALAGLSNPAPYASEGNQANQSAFGEADTIQQQQAQEAAEIAGAITGGATSFLTGGISNLAGGNSFGDNTKSFFSGGIGALAGA
jgi:hypothetical protein